jgi:hypothetical protein
MPARKLMTLVFCDMKGVLMEEIMHQGTTLTSSVFENTQKAVYGWPFETRGVECSSVTMRI